MIPERGIGEHDGYAALAVGWALSSLEPDDDAYFAAHLPSCEICAELVAETRSTASRLGCLVPDERPPSGLRERLLTAIVHEPQLIAPAPNGMSSAAPPAGHWDFWPPPDSNGSQAPSSEAQTYHLPPHRSGARPGARPGAGRAEPAPVTRGGPVFGAPAGGAPAPGGSAFGGPEFGGPVGGGPAGRAPLVGRAPALGPGPALGQGPAAHPHLESPPPHWPRTAGGLPVPVAPRWVPWAAAAAVLLLVVGLISWNAGLRADRARLRTAVAQRDALIDQLNGAGPVRVAALTAAGAPGGSRRVATVVVRSTGVDVVSEALAPNNAMATTYWLWSLTGFGDRRPVPVAGFDIATARLSVRTLSTSGANLTTIPVFEVSEEPGQSRPSAPTHIVALGRATG